MESRSGARGVEEKLDDLIGCYDYDMIDRGYRTMVIHKEVLNGAPPRLEKEEVQNEGIVRFDKGGRS